MNVAIVFRSDVVRQALEMVLRAAGHTIMAPESAEVVICHEIGLILPHLQAGRTVVQFIMPGHDRPARGFLTAPDFTDRFRIFGIVTMPEFGEVPALLAFLQERTKGGYDASDTGGR